MRIYTSLFLALSAFFWACPAQASITLRVAPTTQTVQPGQVVTVSVTVEGFTDVAAYQFSMQWDPAVLQFQSIGYNLAGLSASNFNTLNTASGSLTTAYLPSPAATLPNGASLFSLQFLALGAAGGSTNVAFSGSPTAIAFYNSAVQRQLVTVLDGQMGIQAAGTFSVSGNVRRNSGPAVPGATVAMSGTSTGTDLTNSAGNYLFPNLAAGSNLTLTPTKSTDFQECVSVRDMLFISKHILGIAPLGSPYQMIEADVNQSGSITAFDITQIRDLVLGKIAQFPSNDSWRFVPADFVFPNPFNPFTSVFPENSGITNLQADATRDFIGMKIGDATDCAGDAHGPAFLTLTAPHLTASTGNNINLAITSQGFANVSGLQFTLTWDPAVLQFTGVTSLLPGWSSANYYANGGSLSVCWAGSAPQSLPDGSAVFTLQFTVLGSAGAVSPLAFTETPTRSEVVDGMCNPFDLNKLDGSVTVSYPPCPLACNDLIQVSLDGNCEAAVDQDQILEGLICPGTYTIDVLHGSNVLLSGVNPAVLTGSMIGLPLTVVVTLQPWGNKCWGQVQVQDKLPPICVAPPNVVTDCQQFDQSLASYGTATATDNCCLTGITETSTGDVLCTGGTLLRRFRADDCHGNFSTCTQTIVVQSVGSIGFYIRFPDDVLSNTCSATYPEPVIEVPGCSLVAMSYTDELFTVVPDACFKIERTWTVIDWCVYDPNVPAVQIPNPRPNASPNHPDNLPGPTVSALGTAAPWVPTVSALVPGGPMVDFSSFWSPTPNGGYTYVQTIKVLGSTTPSFLFVRQKCGVSIAPQGLGDCQQVTYDWGDGTATGPLPANATTGHIYSASGVYEVCATVAATNASGEQCALSDTCWQVCITCDTCQNPILKNEWAQFPATTQYLGGNNSYAQMYADAAGNFWATTTFGGNFDNGPDPDLTNQGGLDCIVAKYKSDGTLVPGFAFNIGGTGDEIGAVMAPHPGGGFYVGGISYSPTLTLPSPGGGTPAKTLTNSALQNIFLCRYDANRNLRWALGMHGTNNLQINEMTTDNSGNVYITGLAHGSAIDFNPLGAAVVFPNLNEGYVCKYDSNGLLLWVRLMSGTLHLGLTLDASGSVYVGGHFQGTPTLSGWPVPGGGFPPVGISTAFSSTSSVAPHVAKFDNNGGFQWAFALQNTAQTSTGVVWDMKAKGNQLYIGGVIEANVPTNFDPRGGNAALQGLSFAQAGFVARYDLNGHGQISKTLPQYHNLYEIEVGPSGKIYTAGYYGGSVLLADVYDTDLNLTKSLQTGLGTVADVAWAIAPDPFGDLGMVGRIGSQQFDADPQANDGFEQVFTDGLQHLFIGKYTCDCPGEPIAPCGPCDSISTSLVHKTSDLGCCAAIKVNNQVPDYFTGVQVSVVSGGSLFLTNVTPRPGWEIGGFVNGSSVTLAPDGGGFFPTGNLDCAFICMDDLSAADQYLEVRYFGSDGNTLCRDTLHFACDFCIAITRDSIGCDSAGLKKMKFCVQVAPNLGWDVNALVLMLPPGVTASPAVFSLSDVPPDTEHCYLTTYLSIPSGTHPDSLCIGFTAHEQDVTKGLPPLRCCMVKQCFALPLCLCDPDVTYATASGGQFGDRNCCWDIALHQVPGTVYAVQTNILNPQGVSFGAVAPSVGWDMVPRSATSLLWTPDPSSNLPTSVSLPTLCLQAQGQYASPQLLEIVWFTTTDTIACRDTLTFRCAPDTLCVWLDSMSLVCSQPLPGHNIYTVTVANPFYPVPPPARPIPTHVAVVDVTPASALVGTGVFAIGSLPPGSSTTISIPFNGPPGTVVCFGLNMYRNALPNIFEDCCVTEDTFCVTLRDCDLTPNPNPISIYPNPTRGNITLDFGNTSSPALGRVLVRDLTGRLLREEEVPEGSLKYVVEMPSLGSGLYFVEFMEDRTRVKTEKLSVIR